MIYHNQHGIRNWYYTNDAVFKLLDAGYNAINDSEEMLLLYTNLKKAFDTVNHNILLSKLKHYGIRNTSHDLINNYLSNGTQITKVNSFMSKPQT